MKKYTTIIKMTLLDKLQYIQNQLFGMIMYAIFIFLFLQLWGYMYSDTDLIAGYTLNQMTWYVAFTEIMWGGIRPKTIKTEVSNEIRSGKIAYTISKPFNYIGYLMSKYIGETIISVLTYILIGIIISLLIIGPLASFQLISIPFILITTIMAALITSFIYILISLSSFWIGDNKPFFWIYEKIILSVGVLFPIEIFPAILQPLIKLSPVFTTMYAPAKMAVNFSFDAFIEIFIYQVIYLIVSMGLCLLLYKKGVKKLNVNGG